MATIHTKSESHSELTVLDTVEPEYVASQDDSAQTKTVRPARNNRTWLTLAAVLVAALALHLLTLMRTPAPFVDEAWNASRAWGLLHTGHAFGSLDSGIFEQYDGYWTLFPWLGAAIHAAAVYLLGPGLFSMRLVSLAFGLALMLIVFVIANQLYNSRAGLLAAGLLAISESFFYSAHMARHDIMAATLGFGAIALYLTDDKERARGFPFKSILCGLAVGLTLDVHYNGIIYVPVLLALFLFDYGWRVILRGRFWAFVAGGCLAVLYFAAMHVLPYPQTYFALANLGNGSRVTPPFLTLDPSLWLSSFQDTLLLLGPVNVLLTLVSFAFLWFRRSASDKRLLVLFSVLFLAFAEVLRNKMPWYAILLVPATSLLAAAFLDYVSRLQWRGAPVATLRTALVVGLVAAYVAVNLAPMREDATGDYQAALDTVRQTIPAGSSIIGSQTYWFARPGERYLSWDQLSYYQREKPGSTLEDAFRAFRPDYFVADGWLDLFITNDPQRLDRARNDTLLSKSDLDAFLGKQATLVVRLNTASFGQIRIYKLDWSRSARIDPAGAGVPK